MNTRHATARRRRWSSILLTIVVPWVLVIGAATALAESSIPAPKPLVCVDSPDGSPDQLPEPCTPAHQP